MYIYLHITNVMTRIFTTLLLLLSLTAFGQEEPEYYFTFTIQSKSELQELTRIISIDRVSNNQVWAYASSTEMQKFAALGYTYTKLTRPSPLYTRSITMATTTDQMANWDRYPTYEVYRAMMKQFEASYPSLCKLDSIGTTANGRKIYVAKISANVAQTDGKPAVFLTSTMHGDEITGYALMLRLIDSLLTTYGQTSGVTNLLDNAVVFINPDANPDGTYYGGNSTVVGATRSNGSGIDPNRNFPDPWFGNHPDGNSWTLENQAMMNFANQNRIVLSVNFHGGAEVVNYPFDYYTTSQRQHPDRDWYIAISQDFANLVQADGPSGYFTDVSSSGITEGADWYPITGGRQDYMNFWQHDREVTIELSETKLLGSDQLPNYWNYDKRAFFSYMNHVLTGVYGTVKNENGESVKANVVITSHDKDSSNVWSDAATGTYYRLIYPGTYTFTYSATGYDTYQQSITINNLTDRIEKNVVLIKSTSSIGNNDGAKGKLSVNIGSAGTGIVFTTSTTSTGLLSIYSMNGKLIGVCSVNIQPGVNQWPLEQCVSSNNSLAAGIYIASLRVGGIRYSAKLPVTQQ